MKTINKEDFRCFDVKYNLALSSSVKGRKSLEVCISLSLQPDESKVWFKVTENDVEVYYGRSLDAAIKAYNEIVF